MKRISILSLIITSIFLINTAQAQNIKGIVASITDGDTLTINGSKVRLACIDAPEYNQDWGSKAKLRLEQLAPVGSQVELIPVNMDLYGRTVGVVFSNRGNVNLQMVKEGYAAVYLEYLDDCPNSSQDLLNAEANAKNQKLGLWSQANPCMPWDYREGNCTTPNNSTQCDPNYSGACIPISSEDLNCGDIEAGNFKVVGTDIHRFDGDGDNIACEGN